MARKKRTVDINTTRGLALALPIEPDQRVLVIGEDLRPLVVSLQRTGVRATLVADRPQADVEDQRPFQAGAPLPVDDRAADHVILVATIEAHLRVLPELRRVVAPGGHLLIAAPRPDVRRRGAEAAATPRQLRRLLARASFVPARVYGVRQHLTDVRHLVPLSGPALRWYARSAYLPTTRIGARVPTLALLPGTGWLLARILFPAVAVTAHRASS